MERDINLWDHYQVEARGIFDSAVPRFVFLWKKMSRLIRGGNILDVGFGDGQLLAGMQKSGRDLFGIDISQRNVELTQEQFKQKGLAATLKTGDIKRIPFEDNYFDFVIASEVLEHLDDTTLDLGLAEIKRVLKPSGSFVITTPAYENLRDNEVYCPDCQKEFHRWGHKQSFTKEALISRLAKDFKVVSFEMPALFWLNKPRYGLIQTLKYYIKLVTFALTRPILGAQYSFYLVCQPKKQSVTSTASTIAASASSVAAQKDLYFSFGKNWTDYVNNYLDESKLDAAKESFSRYLDPSQYAGKTLIDVGCGSGIFSLNAVRMGCAKVISFDVDQSSVNATQAVRQRFSHLLPSSADWSVFQGSILDSNLVNRLALSGDIVYSWGVLHHTGDMNQAMKNAVSLVKPGGYFIVAIYNRAPSSEFWLGFKKFYNRSPKIIKILLVDIMLAHVILRRVAYNMSALLRGKKTEGVLGSSRAMSVYYDLIDWLGGYPYEYGSFEEIKKMVEGLGLTLIKDPSRLPSYKKKFLNRISFNNTGNNEFVFRKNP